MKTTKSYIQECIRNGKYFFTKDEAQAKTGIKDSNFYLQVSRLAAKKEVKSIGHSLYMIIPLEYQNLGSLPLEWIVATLMNHLGKKYYIGLLSAASLHGMAHQQPMVFQVICEDTIRPLVLNRGEVHFYRYRHISQAKTESLRTEIGSSLISTKEQTVIDLVRFYKKAGYFDNVATIIRDLSEELDLTQLSEVAHNEPEETALQRLGYIFDLLGCTKQAHVIENELHQRKFYWIKLKPELDQTTLENNKKWKILVNDNFELEE